MKKDSRPLVLGSESLPFAMSPSGAVLCPVAGVAARVCLDLRGVWGATRSTAEAAGER